MKPDIPRLTLPTTRQLLDKYADVVIDLIIVDVERDSIYIQKRRDDRELFPGLWEFPGVLLSPNETIADAIVKNLGEVNLTLDRTYGMVHIFEWDNAHDVATAQFLVSAKGTFTPDYEQVSEMALIRKDELGMLLVEGDETPIYRGAFYAFQYMENPGRHFSQILFYDELVTNFFKFLQIRHPIPKIIISDRPKFFDIDMYLSQILISPDWISNKHDLANANVILHQLFHNYCQQILSFESIKAIRSNFGSQMGFYVDIVADLYSFRFLQAHYGIDYDQYLQLCYERLADYEAKTLEKSKATRLIGAAASVSSNSVIVPVINVQEKMMYTLQMSGMLRLGRYDLKGKHIKALEKIFCSGKVTSAEFSSVINEFGGIIKGF